MSPLLWTYLIYGIAAIGLTAVLARTLYENGKVFLANAFEDNERLARAVNTMLVTGFYMLNLGYAFVLFRTAGTADTGIGATEHLVSRLGILLVSLGILHFVNMGVIWKMRTAMERDRRVPAAVTTRVPPPPTPAAAVAAWKPA